MAIETVTEILSTMSNFVGQAWRSLLDKIISTSPKGHG
jgi:hypothetical protein